MSTIKHYMLALVLSLLCVLSGCAEQPGSVFDGNLDTSVQSGFSVSATSASDSAPNGGSVPSTLPVDNSSSLHIDVSLCDPVSESEHNSCPPETPMETYSSAGGIPYWLYDEIPTFIDILLGQGSPSAVPHLVVRGMAQPDSTRCEIYPIIVPNYVYPSADYLFDDLYHYHCFVDINTTEYIVGAGPAKITVSLHRESLYLSHLADWSNLKDEYINYWNDPVSRTSSIFEGKDLLLFLSLPGTLGVESWVAREPFNLWFIEQNQEGELRAIAQEMTQAQTDEQRSKMDLSLAEMIKNIKEAADERSKMTNGRIGVESYLPSLITDANHLRNFYITVGATYGTTETATVLPPLVPGEDDPDPGTIPTDDGATVSSTPVPGKETTVPPSTDDAGLTAEQDTTTTATNTTTSSTSTETETSVTTEGTPTVTTTTEATETTTTTTESAPTAPVTGTTTTVPVAEPNGEEVAPTTSEPLREETETTTSFTPTETTATPNGDDITPGEESASVAPTDDGVAPAEDGGDSGGQPDAPPADSGTG